MKAENFYASIMNCKHCSTQAVIRDDHTNLPQGFFTLAQPGDRITIMAVAQNPGALVPNGRLTGAQWNVYRGLSPELSAIKQFEFVEPYFLQGSGTVFHSRLLDWLVDLLSVPAGDVFRQAVYTNLVKCATSGNRHPSNEVTLNCHKLNFEREINFWNPQVVVGLGAWTCKQLSMLGIPHFELPHPRHREHRDYHRPDLEKIRACLKENFR